MKEPRRVKDRLASSLKVLLKETSKTSFDLFKITIPLSIIIRLLDQAGLTEHLGQALSPVMGVVGLPGSMGLVLATAMITHLYGAMVVFFSLAPEAHLTVAQVTVLATMMLVAHTLPIELRIAQKAGPRFRIMFCLRIVGALAIGWILHRIYSFGGFLQASNTAFLSLPPQDPGWLEWTFGQIRNLLSIYLIILALLFAMKILQRLNIVTLLGTMLRPFLAVLGMSKDAATVTIIGMTMGLSYGGGLIIQEALSGRMGKRDVFLSLSFMGLMHSVIEDTLLMMVLGGHLSGILWGRLLFSFIAIFLLVKLLDFVSEETFDRFFFRVSAGKN
ncbi:MAG: hypothetical protein GY866_11760 [Proteobacteria bacterium]|nr:hypothetical protein [Pseudomonadota bacterium]